MRMLQRARRPPDRIKGWDGRDEPGDLLVLLRAEGSVFPLGSIGAALKTLDDIDVLAPLEGYPPKTLNNFKHIYVYLFETGSTFLFSFLMGGYSGRCEPTIQLHDAPLRSKKDVPITTLTAWNFEYIFKFTDLNGCSPLAGRQSPLVRHLMKTVGKGVWNLYLEWIWFQYSIAFEISITDIALIAMVQEISCKSMRSILAAVDKDAIKNTV